MASPLPPWPCPSACGPPDPPRFRSAAKPARPPPRISSTTAAAMAMRFLVRRKGTRCRRPASHRLWPGGAAAFRGVLALGSSMFGLRDGRQALSETRVCGMRRVGEIFDRRREGSLPRVMRVNI